MIIVDEALKRREAQGKPVRVGMVGAGFMGCGVTLQILQSVPGMRLVAISNRTISNARKAYAEAGGTQIEVAENASQLEDLIRAGKYAITESADLLCQAESIDVIFEVTGAVEYSAGVVLEAIRNGKHVVLMNAELDGTVGPILKKYADKEGVVLTGCEGDQPGVIMNLYRFVKGLGVRPVLCGNIKGLHDPYRTPTTQADFARRWGQDAQMVTSFADGTKISFEQAIVANATGMRVAKRGMFGPTVPTGTPIEEIAECYPQKELLQGPGIVDYVVGASPAPGVFVLGTHDHPTQKHYLHLYKLGEGPLYCFYTPYHLCHFEVPTSIARAVLFEDPVITPLAGPQVEVIAAAKRDLRAGEVVDGLGGYMTYGLCENHDVARSGNLVPIGLVETSRLKNDIPKDQVLRYDDLEIASDRLTVRLREEQDRVFAPAAV